MASCVPVIATSAGGVVDLIGAPDGVSIADGFAPCERGILCRNGDVSAFAKGLKYLIEIDSPKNQDRLGRARAFVEKKYSSKRLFQDMESLYLELTG